MRTLIAYAIKKETDPAFHRRQKCACLSVPNATQIGCRVVVKSWYRLKSLHYLNSERTFCSNQLLVKGGEAFIADFLLWMLFFHRYGANFEI